MVIVILDTNVLLTELRYITTNILKLYIIGIPNIVLSELNRLKTRNGRNGWYQRQSRRAIQFLYQNMNKIKFQSVQQDCRHLIYINYNDDLIINDAIQRVNQGQNILIFTKDRWLAVKAHANGIRLYRQ